MGQALCSLGAEILAGETNSRTFDHLKCMQGSTQTREVEESKSDTGCRRLGGGEPGDKLTHRRRDLGEAGWADIGEAGDGLRRSP